MGSRQSSYNNIVREINNTDDNKNENNDDESNVMKNISKYKNIILSTWKSLYKTNKEEVGLSIYYSIVFGNTSKGNGRSRPTSSIFLDQNTDLKEQSLRFMDMLNTVINKLDEPKILIEKLNQLSKLHLNAYHVKKQNYMDFQHGFMKAIKLQLHLIWTNEHNNAWKWFWDFIISIMSPDDDNNNDNIDEYIINNNHFYNKIDIETDINNNNDLIDINDYFIQLLNLISSSLKYLSIPNEILQIITLYSLNLTSFIYNNNKNKNIEQLIEIGSCLINGNKNCTATRISNKHYSWCCGTVMSKFWITNKYSNKSPLNNYYHQIKVVIEAIDNDKYNHFKHTKNIEVCIGFTSKTVKHHLQESNGFGDLQCGYAVRSWDKRLIHNGNKVCSDTLNDNNNYKNNSNSQQTQSFYDNSDNDNDDDDDADNNNNEILLQKLQILQQRLNESMKINDELTFIVDIVDNNNNSENKEDTKGSSIEILLNGVKQQNNKLRFTNIPNKIALCTSLWTIGVKVHIKSWTLLAKK